jgi:predicted transcriptional regulator
MRYPIQEGWAQVKASVPPEVKEKVRLLALSQRRAEAEVVRAALDQYIAREERRAVA